MILRSGAAAIVGVGEGSTERFPFFLAARTPSGVPLFRTATCEFVLGTLQFVCG